MGEAKRKNGLNKTTPKVSTWKRHKDKKAAKEGQEVAGCVPDCYYCRMESK